MERPRLPRIVRMLESYLRLIEKPMDYDAKLKAKGAKVSQLKREIARIKDRRLARSAFTLVEMLVAIALTVLMMVLFATIFQFSTQTMSVQKGTAENDQHVRLVMTVLRKDLDNRTMKEVSPYIPNPAGELDDANRHGYFYIAENDPDDETDDVLQFTASIGGTTDDVYYGAARLLLPQKGPPPGDYGVPGLNAPMGTTSPTFPNYPNSSHTTGGQIPPQGVPAIAPSDGFYFYWQNQPEFDDGLLGRPNGAGSSPAAEIRYFLRKGTLYRRVVLIRQSTVTGEISGDPKDAAGNPLQTDLIGTGSTPRNFYTYFDYSACNVGGGLRWHSARTDLDNTGTNAFSLSIPHFRYGFDSASGFSLEWLPNARTAGALWYFVGGYTQEETSFMDIGGTGGVDLSGMQMFGYPGYLGSAAPAASVNPYAPADPTYAPATGTVTYDQAAGKVLTYVGASTAANTRVSEDILMTNVLRFDIKVFDDAASYGPDGAPGFVNVNDNAPDAAGPDDIAELAWPGTDDGDFRDLGHSGFVVGGVDRAFYSAKNMNMNQTPVYCQQNPQKPVAPAATPWLNRLYKFDTWNPKLDLGGAAVPVLPYDEPPFRAPDFPSTPTAKRRPLRAIQIRITFFDPTSQQTRDVTHVYSLTRY